MKAYSIPKGIEWTNQTYVVYSILSELRNGNQTQHESSRSLWILNLQEDLNFSVGLNLDLQEGLDLNHQLGTFWSHIYLSIKMKYFDWLHVSFLTYGAM